MSPTSTVSSLTASAVTSDLPAAQQPEWPDPAALEQAVATLATYPPLVFAGECDVLKTQDSRASSLR